MKTYYTYYHLNRDNLRLLVSLNNTAPAGYMAGRILIATNKAEALTLLLKDAQMIVQPAKPSMQGAFI